MSSFANERTIEYSLITELNSMFTGEYQNIVPFYYWKSREGTKVSRECFGNSKLKVLAVFARRPKINKAYSNEFEIKINGSLFYHAETFRSMGFNAIAGTCLGSSIESASLKAKKNWYSLDSNLVNDSVIGYDMRNLDQPVRNIDDVELLTSKDILKLIKDSKSFRWSEILDKLDEWRLLNRDFNGGLYANVLGGYKPVFIVFE